VEWLGRLDNRVELRGLGIEPAEVEQALASHPAIAGAAASVCLDALGEPRLVAWVVHRSGEEATNSELRAHLREQLPAYAVPSTFVELDVLPGTPGVLDRSALVSPFKDSPALRGEVAPRTDSERLLAELWRAALRLERVGVHDNFFDLGGHSLVCLQVVAQLEQRTGRRISPRLLLLNTLEQVAAQLPSTEPVSSS
jgi:acyl carrier protein